MRQRIEERHRVRALEVDQDHVGELARLQRPQPVRRPERRRGVERHHPERLRRRHRRGVERRRPVQRRRQPQRHPHVEVVARDRPVGADRHPHPGRQHVGDPGDAARELQVRHRVVRHRRPGPRQDRDLLVVEPDAMRQHRPLVEQPEAIEMPDHRPPVARLDVRPLGPGLGGMRREEAAALRRQPLRRAQVLRPDGIGAMRKACPAARRRRRRTRRRTPRRPPAGPRRAARPRPGRSKKMPPVATRSPTARAAATVSRGCQNMSITVVTPPSSSSAKPSVAPSRTVSRFRIAPSAFQTVCSHGSSGRSSTSPRNRLSPAWQCVLISPGISSMPRASITSRRRRRRSPPPARSG